MLPDLGKLAFSRRRETSSHENDCSRLSGLSRTGSNEKGKGKTAWI